MSKPPVAPHPSHEIYEEGLYISDPWCAKCRLSLIEHPQSISLPCGSPVSTFMWQGSEARYL